MRVISGTKRGAVLFSPGGDETRPTTDRVKENIFNLIQFEMNYGPVLDLFSGSGALGIEALSRGCEFCTFLDMSKSACDIIKKNITKTDFNDKSEVLNKNFEDFLNSAHLKYSLIFLDPPYHKGYIDRALKIIGDKNILSADGIIVCECDYDEILAENEKFVKIKEKQYGRVKITVLKNMGE